MRALPLLVPCLAIGCATAAVDDLPLHPATGQEHTVAVPVGEVWDHLVGAYGDVGLVISDRDPASGTIWSTRVRRAFLATVGPFFSPYARCAVKMSEPRVHTTGLGGGPLLTNPFGGGVVPLVQPVRLTVATSIHAEGPGETRVRTTVRASAMSGGPPSRSGEGYCTSTGRLEERLAQAMEKRLATR